MHRRIALALLLSMASCLGGDRGRPAGEGCSSSRDCAEDLVCEYGLCRPVCIFDRDCGEGGTCVALPEDPALTFCLFEDEAGCASDADCPRGLVCGEDGLCRQECDPADPASCGDGRTCVEGACADLVDLIALVLARFAEEDGVALLPIDVATEALAGEPFLLSASEGRLFASRLGNTILVALGDGPPQGMALRLVQEDPVRFEPLTGRSPEVELDAAVSSWVNAWPTGKLLFVGGGGVGWYRPATREHDWRDLVGAGPGCGGIEGPEGIVDWIAWSPDPETPRAIVTSSSARAVVVVDPDTLECTAAHAPQDELGPSPIAAQEVAVVGGGRIALVEDRDGAEVLALDLETGAGRAARDRGDLVRALALRRVTDSAAALLTAEHDEAGTVVAFRVETLLVRAEAAPQLDPARTLSLPCETGRQIDAIGTDSWPLAVTPNGGRVLAGCRQLLAAAGECHGILFSGDYQSGDGLTPFACEALEGYGQVLDVALVERNPPADP